MQSDVYYQLSVVQGESKKKYISQIYMTWKLNLIIDLLWENENVWKSWFQDKSDWILTTRETPLSMVVHNYNVHYQTVSKFEDFGPCQHHAYHIIVS